MRIAIIGAPRPVPSIQVTVDSLAKSWPAVPHCFIEPGGAVPDRAASMIRPAMSAAFGSLLRREFEHGPDGRFGNFQNWIQAGRDLLWLTRGLPESSPMMICEDDALLKDGIGEYVQSHLWPSKDCGVISLFCPNMPQYETIWSLGLVQTRITHSGAIPNGRNNLYGAQCLVFPRKVLEQLVTHPSIESWCPDVKSWERKDVDRWIGRALLELGRTIWHFRPSLVYHYSPPETGGANSSMNHGFTRGPRQAKHWYGTDFDIKQWPAPRDVFQEVN